MRSTTKDPIGDSNFAVTPIQAVLVSERVTPPVIGAPTEFFLLEDDVSFLLLEDDISKLGLET